MSSELSILANITHTDPDGNTDNSNLTDGEVLTQTFSGPGRHQIVVTASADLEAGEQLELTIARRTSNGLPAPRLLMPLHDDVYDAGFVFWGYDHHVDLHAPDGTVVPLQRSQWQWGEDGKTLKILTPLGAGVPWLRYTMAES